IGSWPCARNRRGGASPDRNAPQAFHTCTIGRKKQLLSILGPHRRAVDSPTFEGDLLRCPPGYRNDENLIYKNWTGGANERDSVTGWREHRRRVAKTCRGRAQRTGFRAIECD